MPVTLAQKEKIWDEVLKIIKDRIEDRHVYENFFNSTKISSIEGNLITVITETSLAASLLSTNAKYQQIINDSIEDVVETNYLIKLISQDDVNLNKRSSKEEKRIFFSSCSLNSKFTFDNFVVGSK